MQAKHERINYANKEKVWAGKYKNSQNLLHWHYDCELIYVERGSLNVMCNKKTFKISEGQSLFIDSEQLHYISAESPDSLLITFFFASDVIRQFAKDFYLASPLLSSDYNIPRLYRDLMEELRGKRRFYDTAVYLKIQLLMLNVFSNEPLTPRRTMKSSTESFKRLLTMLGDEYEYLTFENAARFMNMNPSYFSRFFTKLTGMTFSRYLNYVKVNKAVNMIHSEGEAPITEIAIRSGFSTIRNFNRVFKETTGYSPSELPDDFILDEAFLRTGSSDGNPTLFGCELTESSDDLQ